MKAQIQTFVSSMLLGTILLLGCNKSVTNSDKIPSADTASIAGADKVEDPFRNTMAPIQLFDFIGKMDNVIEGLNGTVIVLPKGCFVNSVGEIVEDSIKFELSEALSLEEMVLSNLMTVSNGNPLETDGMIFINATSKGQKLNINPANPIKIEIPTLQKKPGMKAYEGVRDENGNMNWINPEELDDYLITVDINSLNFLPDGFVSEVSNGLPFRKHKITTQDLVDSLYYSLSIVDGSILNYKIQEVGGIYQTKDIPNEPYNKIEEKVEVIYDTIMSNQKPKNDNYGIDPSKIKVIKSLKYKKSLIATREFESRLKVIFKTCKNSILDIYVRNLDKNLFELDSMAAIEAKGTKFNQVFKNFSKLRLKRVRNADKYAKLLQGYYDNQLVKVEAELVSKQKEAIKELAKKNEQAQKVVSEYKKLLFKREKYRMEKYGFNWTKTGWVNIDNGVIPKDWSNQTLEIILTNGKQFDRAYTYLIFTSLKSLTRLNTQDNEKYYVGNITDKQFLMPENKLGILICIGYKNEIPSLAIRKFTIGSEQKITMSLKSLSLEAVKDSIKFYDTYASSNSIREDLEFMAKIYIENQRLEKLKKEQEFIYKLYKVAYPCAPRGELDALNDL